MRPWELPMYLKYFFLAPNGAYTGPWYTILCTFGTCEIFCNKKEGCYSLLERCSGTGEWRAAWCLPLM